MEGKAVGASAPVPLGKDGLPIIYFPSQADWEGFLAAEHATSPGVWLQIAKKATGIPTVTYVEALESALCYGWIDGQKDSLDDRYFLQRFTRRRPRSAWSKINVGHVERLIAAGRMQPAGLAQVEAARTDGRWAEAYDAQSRSVVPDDLAAALAANPSAEAFFATITKLNRYAIIYRVASLKRPETRARKIAEYVQMLAEGRTIYP